MILQYSRRMSDGLRQFALMHVPANVAEHGKSRWRIVAGNRREEAVARCSSEKRRFVHIGNRLSERGVERAHDAGAFAWFVAEHRFNAMHAKWRRRCSADCGR